MHEGEAAINVGWASREIVPAGPVALRGQFYERISQYVRDPLTATALALETADARGGIDRCIFVSCDLATIPQPLLSGVRSEVGRRLAGFDTDCIIMFATHTHTAPYFWSDSTNARVATTPKTPVRDGLVSPTEYFAFLVTQIADAVQEAWNARALGRIGAETEPAVIGHCRMAAYRDGSVRMYGDTGTADFEGILGPNDPNVEMLFFLDAKKRPTGVMVNVCCPSQVAEHKSFVSADFWSEARADIRRKLGADMFVLPATGAAGDQSPRDLVRLRRGASTEIHESPLNSHLPVSGTEGPGWEMYDERGLEILGRRISAAVVAAFPRAEQKAQGSVVFRHASKRIDLPLRRVSSEEYARAQSRCAEIMSRNGIRGDLDEVYGSLPSQVREEAFAPYGVMRRFRLQQSKDFFRTEIHAVRIGDSAVVTNPFELYLEYGLRMRGRCAAKQLLIVQLACDEGGYLPTARAVQGGGYSAIPASNLVGPEGGTLLVGHTVELANGLF
jgi:hypothetical protein